MNYFAQQARVRHHEAQLKIVPGAESWATSTRRVVSESWRSGGGLIAHSTNRPTLVLRVIDSNYSAFEGTSRYGQLLD